MLRNRFVQIGLGLAFLVLIIWAAKRRKPPAPPPKKGVIVLVARRDIQPGEPLSRDNVIQVKVKSAPKEALTDWRDIEGAYALSFIRKGDPILRTQVSPKGEVARGLSDVLRNGWRAMVFETTEAEMPIVRNIRKGDTLDIVAVYQPPEGQGHQPYSGMVAQGVEVLDVIKIFETPKKAAQEEKGEKKAKTSAPRVAKYRLILAVTPDQAERITLARQVAQLHFLLRPKFLPPPSQEVLTVGWGPRELFPGAFPKPKKPSKPAPSVKPAPPSPPPVMQPSLPPAPVGVDVGRIRQIVREETQRQNRELVKAIKRLEEELKRLPPPRPPEEVEVRKHKVEVIMGTQKSEVEVEG